MPLLDARTAAGKSTQIDTDLVKRVTTVKGIVSAKGSVTESNEYPAKSLSKVTFTDDTVEYFTEPSSGRIAELLKSSSACCDEEPVDPTPVTIDTSCESPLHVTICNPTPDTDKEIYCNPATNTLWAKVCTYTYDAANVPTETVLSDTDLGLACDALPQDFEYKVSDLEFCNEDGTHIKSTCQVFVNGVLDSTTVTWTYFDGSTGTVAPANATLCNDDCLKCECWKDKFIEGGLDNTGTNFTHTNQVYNVSFSDGSSGTFNIPSATDWSDQVTQMSGGLGGLMPWAQTVDPFCTIGCGGLPAPFVTLSQMILRYVGFRVCPGDVYPTSVEYSADQTKAPKQLILQYVETDTIYFQKCFDCEGTLVESKLEDGTPYTPVCAIPCEEEFEDTPDSKCTSETILGCDIVLLDPDGEVLSPAQTTPITAVYTICDTDISVTYLQDVAGDLVPYELTGYFGDCDTLEEINPPLPECPEGAVFECAEIGGHYFVLDNSNWVGTPGNHITNGFNFEFTFTHEDGSTTIVQQTADPLFNNFMQVASAALGCTVLPVCANHTSPKGCHPIHAANLANYPAYDAPTFPGDIQNNLTNPAQSELWASGWLFDCGDCASKVVRVEITNANDAAYIGAFREPIVYDKEKTQIRMAVTCQGNFFKDCEGNDIAAPGCCPTPCETKLDLDDYTEECITCENSLFQTFTTAPYTINGVTYNGEDISGAFTGPFPINGNSAQDLILFKDELIAYLESQGEDITYIQGRDGWRIDWTGGIIVLDQSNGLQSSCVAEEIEKALRTTLSECDKRFLEGLFEDCDACQPTTEADAVCNDAVQTIDGVVIEAGSPIIRKTITTYEKINCECVEKAVSISFYDFNNPSNQFTTEPAFTGQCDFETESQLLCDRNGNPIQVSTITVNTDDGGQIQTTYADANGNPVPEPLLPLSICNPDVEPIKSCVEIKGETVYGTLHVQYDSSGTPNYTVSQFTANDGSYNNQLGTLPFKLNCEENCSTCTKEQNEYCYDVAGFTFACPTSTIEIDGEVIDLCGGSNTTNGVIPSSGDICTVGGVRSMLGTNTDRCRSAYPSPLADPANAAVELLANNSVGNTNPTLSQYTNVHIAVRNTFALTGTANSIDFSATWNVGSGIAVGAYHCPSNTDLELIGGTLNTYDTGVCGVETTRGLTDSWGAANNNVNHQATFQMPGGATFNLEDIVFYTIVMGAPSEWLSDIQVNGQSAEVVTCDVTDEVVLADILTNVTGTSWTLTGDVLCTTTNQVLGALTCGTDSIDPTITDKTIEQKTTLTSICKADLDYLISGIVNGIVGTSEDECPCDETCPAVVTNGNFRQDYYDLQDFVNDNVFPLNWNITGTDGLGNPISESISTPFDATWTDNANIYDDLIAALNNLCGVEAVGNNTTRYNQDGAPDICISIAPNVSVSIERPYTGVGDVFTISESGGNTTVTAVDTNGTVGSPVWFECGARTAIGNNNTYPNTL